VHPEQYVCPAGHGPGPQRPSASHVRPALHAPPAQHGSPVLPQFTHAVPGPGGPATQTYPAGQGSDSGTHVRQPELSRTQCSGRPSGAQPTSLSAQASAHVSAQVGPLYPGAQRSHRDPSKPASHAHAPSAHVPWPEQSFPAHGSEQPELGHTRTSPPRTSLFPSSDSACQPVGSTTATHR